jgi:hypothetical protein
LFATIPPRPQARPRRAGASNHSASKPHAALSAKPVSSTAQAVLPVSAVIIDNIGVMKTLWLACSTTAGHRLPLRRRNQEYTKLDATSVARSRRRQRPEVLRRSS